MITLGIGFDIGGTNARAARIAEDHRVLESTRTQTPNSFTELVDWISGTVQGWSPPDSCPGPGVGIAVAGLVHESRSHVTRSVNLPWLEGKPLGREIERLLGAPPFLLSDCDAATWAEFVTAPGDSSCFAHLRLGTGVACGLVVNGRLMAADPTRRTHLPVLIEDSSDGAPLCPCGLRGCLELKASGKALVAAAKSAGFGDLQALEFACNQESKAAIMIVQKSAEAAGRAIRNLEHEFGVSRVVVGGGVVDTLPTLVDFIKAVVQGDARLCHIVLARSRLGDDAGVIGAVQLCRKKP